jgi:AAA+ ATPase superfamily predicted ATPase
VLQTELTDPNRYFAILTAIAAGKTTSNEIAQAVGTDGRQISTYTQKLERLRLIKREVPITEEKAKSRRGRYRILDPLFRFWFRFVYGKENRYERLGENAYEAVMKPELPDFVSSEFEMLCQHTLPELYPEETFLDLGRWWYQEHEIDVVGFTTDGTMVVGECKFTNAPLDYSVLSSLEEHAAEIRWTPDADSINTKYALFTRNGATQSVQGAVSERDDLRLFDLQDITQQRE